MQPVSSIAALAAIRMIFTFFMYCHLSFQGNNTPAAPTREPLIHRQLGAFPAQRLQSIPKRVMNGTSHIQEVFDMKIKFVLENGKRKTLANALGEAMNAEVRPIRVLG